MKVSTKFEVDRTIRCLLIALLQQIRYVTLTFDVLTLTSGDTWRVTWSTPPPSLTILRLSILELCSDISHRIPLTIRCRHCACAVSRDLCVGGQIFPTYLKSLTPIHLPIHCTTFMVLQLRQMELSAKTVYAAVLRPHSTLCMRKITSAFNNAINLLPSSFSANTISR